MYIHCSTSFSRGQERNFMGSGKKVHASQQLKVLKGGKIQLDLNVAVTPEFTQWVLGFGAGVEVIKPLEDYGNLSKNKSP